jgi:hypothetical protein
MSFRDEHEALREHLEAVEQELAIAKEDLAGRDEHPVSELEDARFLLQAAEKKLAEVEQEVLPTKPGMFELVGAIVIAIIVIALFMKYGCSFD